MKRPSQQQQIDVRFQEIHDDFAKDTELYGEFLLEFRL